MCKWKEWRKTRLRAKILGNFLNELKIHFMRYKVLDMFQYYYISACVVSWRMVEENTICDICDIDTKREQEHYFDYFLMRIGRLSLKIWSHSDLIVKVT